MRKFCIAATLPLLGACSAPDPGEVLDRVELSSDERAIADAYVTGLSQSAPMGMLRQRDILYAACYAKEVDMPSSYRSAHLAYLADFTAADEDYYGFFQRYGLDETQAYDLFARFETADQACSL